MKNMEDNVVCLINISIFNDNSFAPSNFFTDLSSLFTILIKLDKSLDSNKRFVRNVG